MTTTVKILIEGNKACEVKVTEADGSTIPYNGGPVTVRPFAFTTMYIHGEQRLSVVEVGDFL